jgi:hypothetical protein
MQAAFPEFASASPTYVSMVTQPPSAQSFVPFINSQQRFGLVPRQQQQAYYSPEDRLTHYYEAKLTQKKIHSNSGTVEIPNQVLQFVIFALVVVLACWGVSYFISVQQVRHCKRAYGGKFAVPVKNEVLIGEIKNYLYGQ